MNVATLLEATAKRRPDHPALVAGDRTWTHAELAGRVAGLAGGLRDHGISPGARIVLLLENRPELLEAMLAGFYAGAVVVPVNQHLHPREVAFIVEDCGAAAVVCSKACASGLSELTTSPLVVGVDGLLSADVDHEDLATHPAMPSSHPSSPDDTAWIFYTSGTTGKPKGAVLSHRNLLAMTDSFYVDIDEVADDAIFLHAAPLTHGSGLYYLPALGRGATNVLSTRAGFDGDEYLELVERHGVTHGAFLAPTMLNRVLAADSIATRDLSRFQLIVCGGAPIYVADLQRARSALGAFVVQLYGQGEAPMTITATAPRDFDGLDDDALRHRLASCGRARTGVEVAVRGDDGRPASTGDAGEVVVRGNVVMTGYWRNPDATATALRDGWLWTGDVGYLDADGYLYLVDRSKDLIITGGSNVYPREVEEVLLEHAAVAEVAVIGLPDREWGEAVTAVVALHEGAIASGADLIDHCRRSLASFKKPKSVVFVDALPKNATGKVLKRDLRERLAAGRPEVGR